MRKVRRGMENGDREKGDPPLYNPRNTGCAATRHIHTKDENEGLRAALDYRIN